VRMQTDATLEVSRGTAPALKERFGRAKGGLPPAGA
jgi:hypothetical protein